MLDRESSFARNLVKAAQYTGATILGVTLTLGVFDDGQNNTSGLDNSCDGPAVWVTSHDVQVRSRNLLWPRRLKVSNIDGNIRVYFESPPRHDLNVWGGRNIVFRPHCDENSEPSGWEVLTRDGSSIVLENLASPENYRPLNQSVGVYWYYGDERRTFFVVDAVDIKSGEITEVLRESMCSSPADAC